MQSDEASDPHRLLTCAQMGDADRHTIASGLFDGARLMENAGAAIMDIVLRDFGTAPHVHIACGPGNNGGDGYVVARLLRERGHPVTVYAYTEPKRESDAHHAARRWTGPVKPLADFTPDKGDLVVDALFGAGARGALPNAVKQLLEKTAGASARILAVDLPSGVDGDSGRAQLAIPYDATVTFYCKKPGHVLEPGRSLCGALHVADIGVRSTGRDDEGGWVFENDPSLWRYLLHQSDDAAHKYQRGHVGVFSGPALATGAARLAAFAAQCTETGAVTLLGSSDALQVHAAHVSSTMLKPYADPNGALEALSALKACNTAVLGPGFSDFEAARDIAVGILEGGKQRLVLDADGLTAFQDTPDALFEASSGTSCDLVLTPHEGEFARLFPDLTADSAASKLSKALAAAERSNAIVVYKGRDTVVAAPPIAGQSGGRAVINTHAPPELATAGSGDVLAGLVAGLLARGIPAFEAAASAVWLHGDAGFRAGSSVKAEDLLAHLPASLAATP